MAVDTFGPPRMTVIDHGIVDGVRWATCEAGLYNAVNGYAEIPEDHPWYGLHYDHEVFASISCPGGLTYGGEQGWIGFDTMHSGDYWPGAPDHWKKSATVVWTPAMVATEAAALAAQIAEARNSAPPTIDGEVISVQEHDREWSLHDIVRSVITTDCYPGVAATAVLDIIEAKGYEIVKLAEPTPSGDWQIPSCGEFRGVQSTGDPVTYVYIGEDGIDQLSPTTLTPQEARLLAAALLSAAKTIEEEDVD